MSAIAVSNTFDWKSPNYLPVFQRRFRIISSIRKDPSLMPALLEFYRANPAQFISDFGNTQDPRNIERGLPSATPFVLFPKQVECVNWIIERWRAGEPGIVEKSRDGGLSWLSISLACSLCLFHQNMVIGFGSRKEEYVDKLGAPKSLFEKARYFMSHLPPEFTGGWTRDKHSPHMRILFPSTGSALSGEAGDQIGRGDRTSLYVIDESAFLERAELIDASLSGTTHCRIDISTPNGMANSFAQRRFSGRIKVLSFHWRDDPRKDQAWYDKQVAELDPVTLAAEINLDYAGSTRGVLIPSAWVQAAIGAHIKLGIEPTGSKRAGLDVADEGVDLNAFAGRHGFLLQHLESWSGKGSDIYQTVIQAIHLCDTHKYQYLYFDGDGLGAGCRGDFRVINEQRRASGLQMIHDEPFRGSAGPDDPDGEMVPERKNKDFFANLKAMSWFALRTRFQNTYRAVVNKLPCDPDTLISIDPNLPELTALTMELSQPTYSINSVGKVVIDKSPQGMKSPNLADATMIAFNPLCHFAEMWTKLCA